MFTRLAHICLLTRDLDATLRFYRDALGLPVRFTFERDGRVVGYYLALGGDTFLEMFESADAEAVNRSLHHFCLETNDLDGLIERLSEHGVPHTEKVMGADHTWQCWFTDPDGNQLEVQEYTEDSLQRRGGVARLED